MRKKIESQIEGTDRRRKNAGVTPSEGEDRISELSDEILISILSRLTLREAVGTSVLSKRWRYVWTCISVLNFDANDIYLPPTGEADKYINWVDKVLAKHRCPNVDEFRVCYNLDIAHSPYIYRWIKFALSSRVQTIELHLSNRSLWPLPGRCYRFPLHALGLSALWPCVNNSSNVFVAFKSLKTLSLKAVDVDEEAIEFFLSYCPLLERLSLHLTCSLRNLKVGPSLLLRQLEVVSCSGVETIAICDTNLVSFTYEGNNKPKMIFKNAPQLVEVSINPHGYMSGAQAMFSMLSCCFSQLEILQLTVRHLEKETLSAYMLPELKNLKQFVLVVNGWSVASLLGYLAMIKNWPNLQRFVLQLSSRRLIHEHDEKGVGAREDVREAASFCHPSLKVVEIVGYCNICDFELFKQIIENAVKLEKISIDALDTHDPNPESERKSEEDYKKLQRSSLEQQLRTQVPPGVELLML